MAQAHLVLGDPLQLIARLPQIQLGSVDLLMHDSNLLLELLLDALLFIFLSLMDDSSDALRALLGGVSSLLQDSLKCPPQDQQRFVGVARTAGSLLENSVEALGVHKHRPVDAFLRLLIDAQLRQSGCVDAELGHALRGLQSPPCRGTFGLLRCLAKGVVQPAFDGNAFHVWYCRLLRGRGSIREVFTRTIHPGSGTWGFVIRWRFRLLKQLSVVLFGLVLSKSNDVGERHRQPERRWLWKHSGFLRGHGQRRCTVSPVGELFL
mmetsp:Transcript_40230/g.94223  ORF Transcript_40230/g.94223 Transcript_40230/m.94223 type:complete len:264 (-) Transcript_40230:168-959(-)